MISVGQKPGAERSTNSTVAAMSADWISLVRSSPPLTISVSTKPGLRRGG